MRIQLISATLQLWLMGIPTGQNITTLMRPSLSAAEYDRHGEFSFGSGRPQHQRSILSRVCNERRDAQNSQLGLFRSTS